MMMQIWGATNKGCVREGNEDAVYPHSGAGTFAWQPGPEQLAQRGQLLIVADGVGGARAGREASHWAIRVAAERYYDLPGPSLWKNLCTAIESANFSLYRYLQEVSTPGASSTMVAAVIHGDVLRVTNVGDSRAYLLQDGQITQLTRDHTLTQRKIDQRLIRPEQAELDSDRSVLTRSLGIAPTVQVDLSPSLQLISGDVVLLCSDGLTDMLSDAEITRLVDGNTPKRAVQRLISTANERGGFDNISVVVARFGEKRLLHGGGMTRGQRSILLGGVALIAVALLCAMVGLGLAVRAQWKTTPAPISAPTVAVEAAPAVTKTAAPVVVSPTGAATAHRATSTAAPTTCPSPTPGCQN
jgi:protein phosphatase